MSSTLRCPCSGQGALRPRTLSDQLDARQCEACEGTVLSLQTYRRWRDRPECLSVEMPDLMIHGLLAVEDSPGARACPTCNRLMQRLRVSTDLPDFRIDRCAHCQLVWFDRGEWEALAHSGLAHRLDEVLADGWQRQLRQEDLRARREAVLRERHGDACIDELTRIRAWLDEQAQPDELLALLRAGW